MSADIKLKISDFIYKYWFPKNTRKKIWIISSRVKTPPQWAYVLSKDYSYLDQLGDKDLIFHTTKFLSRMYPKVEIEVISSFEFASQNGARTDNLLILGGPRWNNKISAQYMWNNRIKNIFRYPPPFDKKSIVCGDCKLCGCEPVDYNLNREKICIHYSDGSQKFLNCELQDIVVDDLYWYGDEEHIYASRINALGNTYLIKDCPKTDYGFFAAFSNDNAIGNDCSRIVMINGIHTFGGLGALYSFIDNDTAFRNYELISSTSKYDDFFCYMRVEVNLEMPKNPIKPSLIDLNNCFSLVKNNSKISNEVNLATDFFPNNSQLFELKNNVEELIEAINVFLKDTTHLKSNNEINKAGLIHKLTEALSQIQALFLNYSEDTFKSIKATYQDCLTQFETISKQ